MNGQRIPANTRNEQLARLQRQSEENSEQAIHVYICRSGQISIEYRVLAWPYGLLGRPKLAV